MKFFTRLLAIFTRPRHVIRTIIQEILFRPSLNSILNKLGGVKLMAWLAIKSLDIKDFDENQKTILVLDRLYFSKDIDELKKYGNFNYVLLHTHTLSITQANWLPQELQEQISYAPRSNDSHKESWAKAEAYAKQIILQTKNKYGIDAILASNVDYWQHESFRNAGKNLNIPFLVLCQELQTLPEIYDFSLKLYRDANFKYNGDGVAVFGKMTGDMLIECDCCTKEQIYLTGSPRIDPWFNDDVKPQKADAITLLAYDGDQYFAPNNYVQALKIFAHASLAHKDKKIEFILKCKDAEDEARSLAHLSGIKHNLIIANDQYLPHLFSRSRLIMGYNSLAIIEALLSNAQLAVPQWGDAVLSSDMQIIDPNVNIIKQQYVFLNSETSWRDLIDEAVKTPLPEIDKKARLKLFSKWFYLPKNNNASLATEEFIEHFIDKHNNI